MSAESVYSLRWREAKPPAEVMAVPSMLSDQERGLLYWLTSEYWSGTGRIIDAGCFQGGSTIALAAGVRSRGEGYDRPPIVVYDRFVVEQYTLDQGFFAQLPNVRPGDDFRPLFDSNLSGMEDLLEVRSGDILKQRWGGEPIEIQFLDVLKGWSINDAVVREFWPWLIPGRSIVVQQDYQYGGYPWLAITMEKFSDHFERLDELPWSTVVYRLSTPLPDLTSTPLSADLPGREKLALMDRAVARETTELGEAMLRLSRALLLYYLGHFLRARRELAAVRSAFGHDPSVVQSADVLVNSAKATSAQVVSRGPALLRPLRSLIRDHSLR